MLQEFVKHMKLLISPEMSIARNLIAHLMVHSQYNFSIFKVEFKIITAPQSMLVKHETLIYVSY